MAKSLQYSQATLIARISTTRTTDDEPIPDTARSSRTNAIISQSRWYKISVRPVYGLAVAARSRDLSSKNPPGAVRCCQIGPLAFCFFYEREQQAVQPVQI